MSIQNKAWNDLGKKLGEFQDNGGDWAKSYKKMRASNIEEPTSQPSSFPKLSVLLGVLLLFSIWGNAYQFGLATHPDMPPCPSFEQQITRSQEVLTAPNAPGEPIEQIVLAGPIKEIGADKRKIAYMPKGVAPTVSRSQSSLTEMADKVTASALEDAQWPALREVPELTGDDFTYDPVLVDLPDFTERNPEIVLADTTRGLDRSQMDGVLKKPSLPLEPLAAQPHQLLKLEHKEMSGPLSAYRVGDIDLPAQKRKKKRSSILSLGGAPLSVSAGLRVSGGFPYQAEVGPSLSTHLRLAYQILTDMDGSPIGLELGFFQGNPGWLNESNVLYRTEQPANIILDDAPEGATVEYEVYNAWGVEIGASEYSEITDWLGIRSRLGLSILSHKQRFRQTSMGEELDFSRSPGLAQPFGMYWNVGPEIRFGKSGHLRLSYHGLVGNNSRKKYFPGRNNGLEGVEFGLGWGF